MPVETVQKNIKFPPHLLNRAEKYAEEHGFPTLSEFVKWCVERVLQQDEYARQLGVELSQRLADDAIRQEIRKMIREELRDALAEEK